jgi:hypothetical protein
VEIAMLEKILSIPLLPLVAVGFVWAVVRGHFAHGVDLPADFAEWLIERLE